MMFIGNRPQVVSVVCALIVIGGLSPTPASAQQGAGEALDLVTHRSRQYYMEVGPIEGLTTAWHRAPDNASIPLGTVAEVRVIAIHPNDNVAWGGAVDIAGPTGQQTPEHLALVVFNELGNHAVSARVTGSDGRRHSLRCDFQVVQQPAKVVRVTGLDVSAQPFFIDQTLSQDEINAQTMSWFFNESIAPLVDFGGGLYQTSIGRNVQVQATVEPAGFEDLVETRINGQATTLGALALQSLTEPGVHTIEVGPPDRAQTFVLIAYRTKITSHNTSVDTIPEGELILFSAETEPAGFEQHVTWLASTKFGSSTQVVGSGPEFLVQFNDTWGPHPVTGLPFQWLGVKADNTTFGQDAKEALCCFGNGIYVIIDEKTCVEGFGLYVPDADLTDTDNDFIPDYFETNDCMQGADICFFGTDPTKADTDGDGIKDGDEAFGTVEGLDLPSMGANPCHKDIFIEIDWVHKSDQPAGRNKPHANQLTRVVTAFANSPVTNPDGMTGIAVHFDTGQGGAFTGGNAVVDGDGEVTVGGSTCNSVSLSGSNEYYVIKNGNTSSAANFASNRKGYFHYLLSCDAYKPASGSACDSSGLGELPGDDLIVSCGQYFTGSSSDTDDIGNTIMHELGHNLLLRHGGHENRNFKPNYNSIMNYHYQGCGVDNDNDAEPDGDLNYSSGSNIDLNEDHLDETKGVDGSTAINWDGVGGATATDVAMNINCRVTETFINDSCTGFMRQDQNCGTTGMCWDSTCDVLEDHDDWSAIELNHLADADFAAAEVISCVRYFTDPEPEN